VRDDIAEGFFHTIGRLLAYVFIDFLYNGVFYYSGWFVLRIVTLGNYPPKRNPYSWGGENHPRGWVAFVGACTWIGVGLLYASHTGW